MCVCDKRDRAITYEFCRDLHLTLGISSNDDGDGNENVKKAVD